VTGLARLPHLITYHTTYCGRAKAEGPLAWYTLAATIVEAFSLMTLPEGTKTTVIDPEIEVELRRLGSNTKPVHIPNGVNTTLFRPNYSKKESRQSLNLPTEGTLLVSLGRITKAKRPLDLIEVFAEVEKKTSDVWLMIARDGELTNRAKQLVKKRDLKRVKFVGQVPHSVVPRFLACCDYYVLPSAYEGHPLSLLEAMACGLPCVVSMIPNLRIVEDANCGIRIDFNNRAAAAERIISYVSGDNSSHSLNARQYAVDNLDWNVIAARYLHQLTEIAH
jgi:glycosyltransferase involved in cell wall biosynthesis